MNYGINYGCNQCLQANVHFEMDMAEEGGLSHAEVIWNNDAIERAKAIVMAFAAAAIRASPAVLTQVVPPPQKLFPTPHGDSGGVRRAKRKLWKKDCIRQTDQVNENTKF